MLLVAKLRKLKLMVSKKMFPSGKIEEAAVSVKLVFRDARRDFNVS